MDWYNRVHHYRRHNDRIVLYYNLKELFFAIIAVKEGDDFSKWPFELSDSLIVTKKMLDEPKILYPKGIVPVTKEFLDEFVEKNILTASAAHILYFNRKNPGFYLYL